MPSMLQISSLPMFNSTSGQFAHPHAKASIYHSITIDFEFNLNKLKAIHPSSFKPIIRGASPQKMCLGLPKKKSQREGWAVFPRSQVVSLLIAGLSPAIWKKTYMPGKFDHFLKDWGQHAQKSESKPSPSKLILLLLQMSHKNPRWICSV